MDRKQLFFRILGLGDPEAETAELARRHRVDHNALAHAYTTAKIIQKYGAGFAEQLGLNNEIGSNFIALRRGTQSTRFPDTFGDLWNNEIGRQIAEFGLANGLGFAELEPLLVEAVRRGDTINDKSRDPRVPSFAAVFSPDGSYRRPNPVWEFYKRHAGKPYWTQPTGIRPGPRRYRPDKRNGSLNIEPSQQVGNGFQNSLEAFPAHRAAIRRRAYGNPSRLHERFFTRSPAAAMPVRLRMDWRLLRPGLRFNQE